MAVAIGFPVILSTGLAGALAGTLFGARGTAVVGLLFTGVTAWIGACLFLAAPRATFAAGPLKRSGPMGRLVMVAVGIALFVWGVLNSAELGVDAIRDPAVANISVERVNLTSGYRSLESEIVTLEGRTYQTVYGWKIWGSVPTRARLLLGSESGRVLWLEPR
ncbi:MAG: hypothetical protein E6I18_14530 [Chloroflexi bacterium]|nr:MAG: hypothetical protein E6I18_14530 [Chloroflexota bacterium]